MKTTFSSTVQDGITHDVSSPRSVIATFATYGTVMGGFNAPLTARMPGPMTVTLDRLLTGTENFGIYERFGETGISKA